MGFSKHVVGVMVAAFLLSFGGSSTPDGIPVPEEVHGWRRVEAPRIYDRESLFDYINGGAELYLAYSFKKLYAYSYVDSVGSEIRLDIFDMGNSSDAFGVFSAEREGPDAGIGQGSEYDGRLLRFWKGRYFVSIVTLGESSSSVKAVRALGTALDERIRESGTPPAVIELLPAEGLLPETVKYFRSHHLLNMHYYVASENILGLSPDTDAVLARYEEGDNHVRLLLVHYPSPVHAEWARGQFKDVYMPDATEYVVRTEDGKWTATELYGSLLAIVFDASSHLAANTLLERVGEQGG